MSVFTRPCRDITALVVAAEDRRLSPRERLAVRVHLAICTGCTRFSAQMSLMRGALTRWRGYRDAGGESGFEGHPGNE